MNSLGFPDYNLNGVITFNSGTADAQGSYWFMDGEMAGWDSPDGRVTMLTRIGSGPIADGEYPADEHYRGRTLVFKLYAACYSETQREGSRLLLAQALDLVGNPGTLTVNEATPKFVTITRSGNSAQGKLTMIDRGLSLPAVISRGFTIPQPNDPKGLYILEANIEVYATDPRKYAVTPVTYTAQASGYTFTNPGNTRTVNAVFTLHNPSAGSMILNVSTANQTGVQFQVPTSSGPALPGFPNPLVIDAYQKLIRDASNNNYYYLRNLLGTTAWPAIIAGSNNVTLSGPTSFDLTYYPAWI